MEGMHIHGFGEKMFSKQHELFDRLNCKHKMKYIVLCMNHISFLFIHSIYQSAFYVILYYEIWNVDAT